VPGKVLARLAESTSALQQAVKAGDFQSAEETLTRRQAELHDLQLALEGESIGARELEELDKIFCGGAEAARALIALREMLRVRIGELEGERLKLLAWAPSNPGASDHLDMKA